MLRNVTGQKWRVYAYDRTTGAAKTGDAANITARITKDNGSPATTNDANPTEVDSTNEPGYYEFDMTQAETNAYEMKLSAKSGTANVNVIPCPAVQKTVPQYLSLLGVASDGDLSKVNAVDTAAQWQIVAKHIAYAHGRLSVVFVDSDVGDDIRSGLTPDDAVETIDAAEAIAGALGMVFVMPSATPYVLANGASFYFAPHGVVLNSTGTSPMFVAGSTLIGDATINVGADAQLYVTTTNNSRDKLQCRSVIGSSNDSLCEVGGSATGCKLDLTCDTLITTSGNGVQAEQGEISVRARRIQIDGWMASVNGGKVTLEADNIVCSGVDAINTSGSGRVNVRGNVTCTHASTNGLSAGSGITVVAERGSIESTTGRPHLTAATGGTVHVVAGFGYDPLRVVDDGVIIRNVEYPLTAPDADDTTVLRKGPGSITGATVETKVDTLLSRVTSTIFSGITSLAQWLGAIAGMQVANTTARNEIRATGAGSGTFDETLHSLEALVSNAQPIEDLAAAVASEVVADMAPTQLTESAATKLSISADTMAVGTVSNANFTPTTTQFRVTGITDAEEDQYKDRRVLVVSGTLIRQVSSVAASELISGETHITLIASKPLTQPLADGDNILIV